MITKNKKMTMAELIEAIDFLQITTKEYSMMINTYGDVRTEEIIFDVISGDLECEALEYYIYTAK